MNSGNQTNPFSTNQESANPVGAYWKLVQQKKLSEAKTSQMKSLGDKALGEMSELKSRGTQLAFSPPLVFHFSFLILIFQFESLMRQSRDIT